MGQGSTFQQLVLGVAMFLGFVAVGRAGDSPGKPWHGSPDLSMGSQNVEVGGHCLRMSAAIIDSSLAKLHKRKTANGTEFHRGKVVVDQFPEDLLVEVTVIDCVSPYAVAVDKDVLASLRFAAIWRRGDDERPSEVYVPRPRLEEAGANDTFRSYELSVPSANVPLSDQLVLTVSSEGKQIARFVDEL